MIDDREIWGRAIHVLRQHGDAAWFHASQRADELFAAGDTAGQLTWIHILRAYRTTGTDGLGRWRSLARRPSSPRFATARFQRRDDFRNAGQDGRQPKKGRPIEMNHADLQFEFCISNLISALVA